MRRGQGSAPQPSRFNVDDAVVLWTALKDLAEVCYPLEPFHYGMREFAIYDNNGYMLQFGSPVRA